MFRPELVVSVVCSYVYRRGELELVEYEGDQVSAADRAPGDQRPSVVQDEHLQRQGAGLQGVKGQQYCSASYQKLLSKDTRKQFRDITLQSREGEGIWPTGTLLTMGIETQYLSTGSPTH